MSEFQSAEDFERQYAHLIKEQEDAEAKRNAPPPQKQAKKNKRQEVDAESRRIEQEATEETGLTNWAGRLLGQDHRLIEILNQLTLNRISKCSSRC